MSNCLHQQYATARGTRTSHRPRPRTADPRPATSSAGERLPTVRALAAELGVDPGTAAAAYRLLRERGFVISDGRRGTRVAAQLEPRPSRVSQAPPGVRDLASGVVDPVLVPEVGRALERVAARRPDVTRYEENAKLDALVAHARAEFGRAGVDATALSLRRRHARRARTRPAGAPAARRPRRGRGSRLPATARPAAGAEPPGGADRDRRRGPRSRTSSTARWRAASTRCVVTPHGQNPFGASLSEERASTLRAPDRRARPARWSRTRTAGRSDIAPRR